MLNASSGLRRVAGRRTRGGVQDAQSRRHQDSEANEHTSRILAHLEDPL